ncbi:bile acid:sodium symporter family protein [Halalkalibacter hemicellulosilyticus]|uniref:Bile acid sodium symporter n=1 Tax=Halalkalibacter hemicellulosilyticusJCM 9152 TaxID=1236971 RepID=W4QGW1_9BACI|nr:bile acid:sodium symporter family protein [Halalkalibacter hemicellulosilyticus]GAE30883.1 bile acid sodium symporter [Halalkalibacter hemicellulosilyticusJCM 9152]
MLKQINSFLEKRMLYLTPIAVLIGLICTSWLQMLIMLVPWVFAYITFVSSIGINITQLKKSFTRPLPILLALSILQIIMPLIAFSLGHLLFSHDLYTLVGIIIAFIIPTGVISLMWVSIYKGDLSITLLIVLMNTLLSPILVPLSLQVFVGANIEMNTWEIMPSLFWMIVVPSLLGIVLSEFSLEKGREIKSYLSPFSKIGLLVVIAVNSSVAAPAFQLSWHLVKVGISVLVLAMLGYLMGVILAQWARLSDKVTISLLFNSGMRNISVGATIAILYFPAQVSVPIVIGTLFQQTLAALSGKLLSLFLQRSNGL